MLFSLPLLAARLCRGRAESRHAAAVAMPRPCTISFQCRQPGIDRHLKADAQDAAIFSSAYRAAGGRGFPSGIGVLARYATPPCRAEALMLVRKSRISLAPATFYAGRRPILARYNTPRDISRFFPMSNAESQMPLASAFPFTAVPRQRRE